MGERKIFFGNVLYGLEPFTSCMHACSGSGRHVIQHRIDIQVTMYWDISHYGSPCPTDHLISRTRGPIARNLSLHGDTSWTSMLTSSSRSTALLKLWQIFFLSPMSARLRIPNMESGNGKFCGCADRDWTQSPAFCANHYIRAPW